MGDLIQWTKKILEEIREDFWGRKDIAWIWVDRNEKERQSS